MRPLVRSAVVTLLVAASLPAGAAPPLLIERNVVVDSMVSDRFTWIDAAGQVRSASLAHNDGQFHPVNGSRGGELREYRYLVDGTPRIVRASAAQPSGFGYVVAHPEHDDVNCVVSPDDKSPLGHFFGGSFLRIFEGRHHAIFQFIQNYPRYC